MIPAPSQVCEWGHHAPGRKKPPLAYGGIESIRYLLVEGLVKGGHDVTVIDVVDRQTRVALHANLQNLTGPRVGQSFPEAIRALVG
jgi:hypothetical protein